jgi:hypothetical protein
MEIIKRLDEHGSAIRLFIKVIFTDEEMRAAKQFGLLGYRIKTRDGPFVGRDLLSSNMKSAYRCHLGRIKNRWSPGLVRTSGFVLIDTVATALSYASTIVHGLARIFVGRRTCLLTATRGITFRSRRIERVREAELFILLSLAAIAKALEYATTSSGEVRLSSSLLLAELQGLDFSGAGSALESEFESVEVLADVWSKVHS